MPSFMLVGKNPQSLCIGARSSLTISLYLSLSNIAVTYTNKYTVNINITKFITILQTQSLNP